MSKSKNPVQPFLEFIPKPLRNRYALVGLTLLAWVLLFDKNDLFTQMSLQQSLNKIEADKTFYKEEIQKINTEKSNFKKNAEKHAREKYFMSRPDEDVFIIEKKN
ncbi:MAG: hypothetical protein R2879_12830 [Saprospiraceae bacterium]